jgi:hypothetical protein
MWLDSGSVAPASIASAGPTDQVLSLLNVPLPQVHSLYSLYYSNLASGFAVTSIRNPSFVRVLQPNSTTLYSTQQVKGSLTVEPLLLFTTYLPGLAFDAESSWKLKNLIPGLSFGLSLSVPANSFYVGASSEIWRNLQVAAGLNIGKVNTLSPAYEDPTSNAAPGTVQTFTKGVCVGLTLNLDFIAGLFGAKI